MNKRLFIQLVSCIVCLGCVLFGYMKKQNEIMKLRLEMPNAMDKLRTIQEDNALIMFKLESSYSPSRLMEILQKEEYKHFNIPDNSKLMVIEDREIL